MSDTAGAVPAALADELEQRREALAAANIFYPITYEDNLVRLLQNEEDERMLASHLLQAYEFVAARPRPSQSLTRSGNEQERATPPPRPLPLLTPH